MSQSMVSYGAPPKIQIPEIFGKFSLKDDRWNDFDEKGNLMSK